MNKGSLSIIIPSFNPDEKLLQVVKGLLGCGFEDIIIVDDGSDVFHKEPFVILKAYPQCVILTHEVNRGKGRALKTAFSYILENRRLKKQVIRPDTVISPLQASETMGAKMIRGVITVDGDNQHRQEDIVRCQEELLKYPDSIVLGCRDFSGGNVPVKSRLGNRITSLVFRFACGMKVSDTQTGLRAIPIQYLEPFCLIEGERYEYETNMLLKINELGIDLREVRIETVYIDHNCSSHFNPIRDSFKIYLIIIKFLFSSLMSSVIDLSVFALLIFLINDKMDQSSRIFTATVSARALSSFFNFFFNRKTVFRSNAGLKSSIVKYYILCVLQMLASYGSVYSLSFIWRANSLLEILLKIVVDIVLFIISFQIQRNWVFKKR